MRITEVNIDRFGVWNDLTLPLNERGITVFYGPNEAGKSTLMRFVRGTLYGFNPTGQQITRHGLSTEGRGALSILQGGEEHIIRREAEAGQRGRLRVDQFAWGQQSEQTLKDFLGDTDEQMFENIFAIGLSELQELATLSGDEVANHIYGLSLGLEGERILAAGQDFDLARSRLINDDHTSGELVDLAQRLEEIDRQLADTDGIAGKHRRLHDERTRLQQEIDELNARRRTLEDNLRGYRHLERVQGPWSQERKLRHELSSLAVPGSSPAQGLSRYDAITGEIRDRKQKRGLLLKEARRLYHEVGEQAGDTTLQQHECAIRRLAGEREEMQHRQRRLSEKQARARQIEQQLSAKDIGSH